MGFYIEGPQFGKVEFLVKEYGAVELRLHESALDIPPDRVIVCVVHNGPFEAAAVGYDRQEIEMFLDPTDPRPRRFVHMDRAKAYELSRFKAPKGRGG